MSTEQGTLKYLYMPIETIAGRAVPGVSEIARRYLFHEKERRKRSIEKYGSPLVSVVMPVHNASGTIARAIESLLQQSYENLELLIVNDASSDETIKIVAELACNEPRVQLLNNTLGRGAALARNFGMAAATGEFLCFQDADDRSIHDRIEQQLALLLLNKDAVVSRCDYYRENSQEVPVAVNGRILGRSILSMMFRREAVLARIGYMRNTEVSEDSEYYQRIKLVFGQDCTRHIWKALYIAGFNEASLLFSDGTTNIDSYGNITHLRSVEAQESIDAIALWHSDIRNGSTAYIPPEGVVQ